MNFSNFKYIKNKDKSLINYIYLIIFTEFNLII